MFARAASWVAIARAALPGRPVRRRDVTSATMIGVLMSATLPARLGEPARAMVLARRVGRMRETFPVLIGTLVSQTALNIVALVAARRDHRLAPPTSSSASTQKLFLVSHGAAAAPGRRPARARRWSGRTARAGWRARSPTDPRRAASRSRTGLTVFRDPRRGSFATVAQLGRLVPPAARLLGAVRRPRPRPPGRDRRRRGRASSRSTSPRSSRRRRPTSASSSSPIISVLTGASASRPPTRSPTASSCRRSRSRPRSRSASPRWSARASPGRTCACAPSRPPRSAFSPTPRERKADGRVTAS